MLRAGVLDGSDDAGGDMGEAHGRVGGVDVLAAGTTGAHHFGLDVLGVDVRVGVFVAGPDVFREEG